jgi:hypothetical protein
MHRNLADQGPMLSNPGLRLFNPQHRHLPPHAVHVLPYSDGPLIRPGDVALVLEGVELALSNFNPFLVVVAHVREESLEASVLVGGDFAIDLGFFDDGAGVLDVVADVDFGELAVHCCDEAGQAVDRRGSDAVRDGVAWGAKLRDVQMHRGSERLALRAGDGRLDRGLHIGPVVARAACETVR